MNKAFLFDMDGVLINSEQTWEKYGEPFYEQLFGKEIRQKIGNTTGITANIIHQRAVENGSTLSKDEYFKKIDEFMVFLYKKSEITEGLEEFGKKLLRQNYKLGLVSSSRMNWINLVLPRVKINFECIISINDTLGLRSKPHPDGFNKAIKLLGAAPHTTVILEDSNAGIQSAMATGAFTIGFTKHLIPGYKQLETHTKAQNISEILEIIKKQ